MLSCIIIIVLSVSVCVTVADSLWKERLIRVKFSLANTLVAMQVHVHTHLTEPAIT